MRSLQVYVRTRELERVLSVAEAHGAETPVALRADRIRTTSDDSIDEWSLVFVHLPNENVGAFVDDVRRGVEDAQFILQPVGTLPLETPLTQLDSRVREVTRLSTLELVISSLQSIGAWRGMLMFSVLAGIIGAYGLIFDISYILVAAMLVNPMGAPALVSVIGIAIGDARMVRRGGLRFVVSLAVQAAAAALVGVAYGLSLSTPTMEQVTALSVWGVVIAFAAGAAGAQAQVRSARDSLVSGTAAGFMVAAALAPPAAVLGLSTTIARWDYAGLMVFLLALQYHAIALGGWVALAIFGVRPSEPSIGRGSRRSRTLLLGLVAAVTAGLVFWQSRLEPRFLKADLSRVGLEITHDAVDSVQYVILVESDAHFTRRNIERHGGEALLLRITVEKQIADADDDSIATAIRNHARRLVQQRMENVVPFVDVTVLPGPGVESYSGPPPNPDLR